MEAVARYLATLREGQKLSQKQVGDAVGVSDRQVSNWEKGENQPKLGYVPALRRMLDELTEVMAVGSPSEALRRLVRCGAHTFGLKPERQPRPRKLEGLRDAA